MPKEILDDPSPNNSRDDFWDDIERQESESLRKVADHLEEKRIQELNKTKRSHINVCKRSLYVALLDIPADEWNDSDADIGMSLMQDPYIQSLLEKMK